MLRLQRAYHESGHILLAHKVYDILIIAIYRKPQQPFPFQAVVGTYEAFDGEPAGRLVAYAFGKTYATVLCTIDEDAFAVTACAEEVVHCLDDDSGCAHE